MTRAWPIAIVLCWPALASAQVLHLFGPPGDGTSRRLVAVVETAEGSCVAAESVELTATDPAVAVTLGERLGACARAIEVRTPIARERLVLTTSDGLRAELGLDEEPPIELEVERTEGSLIVRALALDGAARPVGHAYWPGGDAALVWDGDVGRASVPVEALVGVLVRSGEGYGAAALPPTGAVEGPSLLLLPLELAAGSMPRPAALLVVADAHGHLSRAVPLQVSSEAASLERLVWQGAGIAEVWLAPPPRAERVDLSATTGSATASALLEVSPGAPVDGAFRRVELAGEQVILEVEGRTLDGAALHAHRLAVRVGSERVPADDAGAVRLALGPGRHDLVLVAEIDGRWVPIAWHSVELASPSPPALAAERAPLPSTVVVRAMLLGAIDGWGRPGGGAGAAAVITLDAHVALELGLRYLATFVSADGQGVVEERLEMVEHTTELALLARLAPLPPHLDLFVGPTLAAVVTDGAFVGSTREPEHWAEVRGGVALGVGTGFALGPVHLGADLGARFYAPLHGVPFEAPWVRVGLELWGGFDAR